MVNKANKIASLNHDFQEDHSMFELIDSPPDKTIALRIRGEITSKDSEKISGIIERSVLKHGAVKLLIVIEHYPSLSSAESLYEDLRFAHLYSNDIERMAVVGDRAFKHTWVALFGLFSGLMTRYFDKSEIHEAMEWLKEP